MSRLKGQLTDPLLSVVMPAYNEEATIEEMIRRVLAVPIRTELIVVDDGSKDRTREIHTRLAAELPVRVIFQPVNGGKGAALRRGFQEVTGDLVVIQDADLEYDPNDIPRLIKPITDGLADVDLMGRFVDASGTAGENADYLWVYDRAGEPCLRCKTVIRRSVLQGRATFYCPTCQKP